MPTTEQLHLIIESQLKFPHTRHPDDPMYTLNDKPIYTPTKYSLNWSTYKNRNTISRMKKVMKGRHWSRNWLDNGFEHNVIIEKI